VEAVEVDHAVGRYTVDLSGKLEFRDQPAPRFCHTRYNTDPSRSATGSRVRTSTGRPLSESWRLPARYERPRSTRLASPFCANICAALGRRIVSASRGRQRPSHGESCRDLGLSLIAVSRPDQAQLARYRTGKLSRADVAALKTPSQTPRDSQASLNWSAASTSAASASRSPATGS
jgi:hypothetical protein